MMSELNKYFKSETIELLRSQIHPSTYNPRTISDEARKLLKKSVKRFGVVGGLVVNKTTGNTLVSGHQKLSILDELNKFPENDYLIKVELIEVDLKTEKELNIFFNNPNSMGSWDYDKLAELIPDIDYKDAGLTEEDLNLIGVDFLLQTEEESNLANELENVMAPTNAIKEANKAEKIAHNKEIKAEVNKAAQEKAQDMEAYVMLSFDSYEAKAEFMERFGYDESEKFIKGECFSEMVERV